MISVQERGCMMKIIDRPTVVKFCTNCSASNELDATKCGNCMKELVEGLDDYCSLCGCEQ